MKINFVLANADMSGGVRVVASLARELAARGHDVRAFSTPMAPPSLRKTVRRLLRGRGLPKRMIGPRPSFFDGTGIPLTVLPKFRPIMDRDLPDADVVVATWWETAPWVSRLSPSKGAKAFLIQHYETWGGNPRGVDAAWRLPLHKIVISQWLADLAKNAFGDSDYSMARYGVDMNLFNAPPRGRQERPTVGFLYSHTWFKGCDVTLKALEIARQQIPDLHVITFGLHKLVNWLPLPPGSEYTFNPPQQSIKDIYARCDVWLCGSRAEGFHMPPMEAMACRCPVVSTRIGGPMDMVQEGQNGYLVDVEDHEALAQRLVDVLRLSADTWQKMSDAAYATACRYTWQEAGALMEAALQRAIDGSRHRHRIGA